MFGLVCCRVIVIHMHTCTHACTHARTHNTHNCVASSLIIMLYYVFSGRVIQLLTVLEQMRAQMNRIEAKVNRHRIALDRTDTPAPLPDNVQLPLANTQDVDNLEATLKEPGNAVEQSLVCMFLISQFSVA